MLYSIKEKDVIQVENKITENEGIYEILAGTMENIAGMVSELSEEDSTSIRVEGQIVGGKANGIVTVFDRHGDLVLYCKDGMPSDIIRVIFTNGNVFEGMFPEGPGRFMMPDGQYYCGLMRRCIFQGKGTFWYDDGVKIEGNWMNGKVDGEAKITNEYSNEVSLFFNNGQLVL